jgi:hypothetical protein
LGEILNPVTGEMLKKRKRERWEKIVVNLIGIGVSIVEPVM